MLLTIATITTVFIWMLWQCEWLSCKSLLAVPESVRVLKHKAIPTSNRLPVKELKLYLKKLLQTELELDGIKSKPKNITIGYGVFNAKLIKELVGLIPDDALIEFKSYPYKPAYKDYQADGGYIPYSLTPAKLECIWENGSKAHWTLNSGYGVSYWAMDDNCPVGDDWTPEKRKAYGIKPPKIAKVYCLPYSDENPRPANGISLLDVELPLFK